MASSNLYPPIVETTAAAFLGTNNPDYKLNFVLSRFTSSIKEIKSVHVSVIEQTTGRSIVNTEKFPTSLIILNNAIKVDENGNYYVIISSNYIKNGWKEGTIYKFQIRLSTVEYQNGGQKELIKNADKFSEWSTYSTVKVIALPHITVSSMNNFDNQSKKKNSNKTTNYKLVLSTLDFTGNYEYSDSKNTAEPLYSYSLILYKDGEKIEESGQLYASQYYSNIEGFNYTFKHEFEEYVSYSIDFEFTTINKYNNKYSFNFEVSNGSVDKVEIIPTTIDTKEASEAHIHLFEETSIGDEEEEGRIGIKLKSIGATITYTGNLCIRRSSSKDNYSKWEDIKIFVCTNKEIDNLPIIYDNTIESGVWYKYGVQTINAFGRRGPLTQMNEPVMRKFFYSYLIGEGGKQLKLKYNNTMDSFAYQYSENKTETIGGQFPFITRNGNTKYRTFPLNGLISYTMDDFKLFTTDKELYQYDNVIDSYNSLLVGDKHEVSLENYNYKKEFDFREAVLAFLQDGKPKLFKSPSEGNIIIRLMQVTGKPVQSLNRMIHSFGSTAYEVAEATMANYLKYGFIDVGEYSDSFIDVRKQQLGQLIGEFDPKENLITRIVEKENIELDGQDSIGNKVISIKIYGVKASFITSNAPIITVSEDIKTLGHTINTNIDNNDVNILVRRSGDVIYEYDFGSDVVFTGTDSLSIQEADSGSNKIYVQLDYLYDLTIEEKQGKELEIQSFSRGIGQFYGTYDAYTNFYNEVAYQFARDYDDDYSMLDRLSWIRIEAIPGDRPQIYLITDGSNQTEIVYMNDTRLYVYEGAGDIKNLKYCGRALLNEDGSIARAEEIQEYLLGTSSLVDAPFSEEPSDMLIDYMYSTIEGNYKEALNT